MKQQTLNTQPIIVNGFGHGGTNILMNLLLSHPGTACPTGELHKVFKGGAMGEGRKRRIFKKLLYDYPIRFIYRQDIFDRLFLEVRCLPNKVILKYIDWILYHEKKQAFHESHNLWKNPTTHYTKNELSRSRLTVKAHNGMVYLNDIFRTIYKDVSFIAVVRNGLAVCEGFMRRGWSLEDAAEIYNKVGNEIARNMTNPDYLCMKFENIIADPIKAVHEIYSHCNLNHTELKYFRLQHKPVMSGNGKPILNGDYKKQVVWYKADEINRHFDLGVNRNQIARLKKDDRKHLKKIIELTMQKLNYLEKV